MANDQAGMKEVKAAALLLLEISNDTFDLF